VATAFGVRALHSEQLAVELRADLAELRAIVASAFGEAGAERPEREAIAAIALVDGLTEQLLFAAIDPDEAVAVLDAQLERALGSG
jgi:hypothetical protein